LDEPTSGLDPNQIQDIRDLIRNFGKEKTLIFSTHIMQEVKALCDRVIIINNGSIVADDPIDMLQEKLSDRQIVHVEFNKDLPIDLLKNIPGVQSVRTNGKARFTVYSSNQKDLREMLFNFSVQNNYIIYEMNKDKNSVEEVFSLLTKSSPKD
ncbi:MAG TPA: gliding motility-associated ABC transporter ATP-binding subunit GldA, partial [Saprospiraceae bacterium]|nr:gliding motility-associated ABC transporter ATP-binding subunit GldA [Saprospiraceae bacterium]